LKHRPWQFSTGPRTAAGKAKVARNGKTKVPGEPSVRQLRSAVGDYRDLIGLMRATRGLLTS
jgi:hypothetical protein